MEKNFMKKDIFELTKYSFEKKINAEKIRVSEMKDFFCKILNQIKNTSEKDGWHRLVIFAPNENLFSNFSHAEKMIILYYLRSHPNIISTISNKESRNIRMKPFVYKWVTEKEKQSLGIKANYFRNIPDEVFEYISSKISPNFSHCTEILTILGFLYAKKNNWIELSPLNLAMFCGTPIENTRFALNFLLENKLILIAYTAGKQRKGHLTPHIRALNLNDNYEDILQLHDIDAVKILTYKDATNEEFNFSVQEYFYSMINSEMFGETQNTKEPSEEKTTPGENVSLKFDTSETLEDKNVVTESYAEKSDKLPENILLNSNKMLDEMSKTFSDIKNFMQSFNNITETMYKNDLQRNEILSGIVKMNENQRKENENLINQLTAMKKIVNRQDREKNFFIKKVQDALNMMMGQIISTTDEFTKIPRHLMDERKISKHKADVIKIAVRTAYDIQKIIENQTENKNSR